MSHAKPETPLAAVMRRHLLTQVAVAAEADISQAYLSQLASGDRVPSLAVAGRLLRVLRERTGEPLTFEELWPDTVPAEVA